MSWCRAAASGTCGFDCKARPVASSPASYEKETRIGARSTINDQPLSLAYLLIMVALQSTHTSLARFTSTGTSFSQYFFVETLSCAPPMVRNASWCFLCYTSHHWSSTTAQFSTSEPTSRTPIPSRRFPRVERHEDLLHRRGTVGLTEHISNDCRHSPRGGLSE
jgi:hypothetical protein